MSKSGMDFSFIQYVGRDRFFQSRQVADGAWVQKLETCRCVVRLSLKEETVVEAVDVHPIGSITTSYPISYHHTASQGQFSELSMRWYVSDEPFGLIRTRREKGIIHRKSFIPARQVHRGELGQYPQVQMSRFVEHSRQPHIGERMWARLAEVADLAKLDTLVMLERSFMLAIAVVIAGIPIAVTTNPTATTTINSSKENPA